MTATTRDAASDSPAEAHHSHRDVHGGWMRPAVFGVMDGLVSNAALVVGVAGAGAASGTVLVAGAAGLVAGAFSMASGEYVSVRSERELTELEVAKERRELERRPEAELAELAELYRSRGVDAELADEVARQLSRDAEQTWRLHTREELGIDPDALPSPWRAAAASFVCFALGALVPLLPFLLGFPGILPTALLTLLALSATGAFTARFTSRGWLYSGARQALVGSVAAAVTFAVGTLLGTG